MLAEKRNNSRQTIGDDGGMFLSVKVGDKAPDFTLPSQMGDNVKLSEFLGKKNIVL